MPTDAKTRRALIEFELEIDAAVADETVVAEWGRAFLTPSLPQVWDASSIALEAPGLTMREVAALADEVLGGAGFAHRTVAICDEEDGARLVAELGSAPGWAAERIEYMAWREESDREPAAEVREATFEDIASLRAELTGEFFAADKPDREQTIAQLVELDRRACAGGGDHWLLAPAADPAAACCLFSNGGAGQIENVGTLRRARGEGLAQAVTLAALAASRAAGHQLTFLADDADDWPRLMYAKLGFEPVGDLHVLRRYPAE
jgi:GNAT superfamily N-acetyltransferase